MMKILVVEWGEYGICLNCVVFGMIKIDVFGCYLILLDWWKELNCLVLNCMGVVEDIVGMIIFLVFRFGGFVIGEDIYVDGGEILYFGYDVRDMINFEMFERCECGDGKYE